MSDIEVHASGEDLLEKVDAVLEMIPPVYQSENFDSLKQVRDSNDFDKDRA